MNAHGGHLQLRDLLLRFPGQARALFNIPSLEIHPGQSIGIQGPSGAGKTTLFHCLSGIARPTAGQVRWNDADISTFSNDAATRWRHQQLGLIFQEFHLIEGLSALDNVLLPTCFNHWRPPPALRQRARQLLDAVDLAATDRLAALLSRGERQRVAFARALIHQPRIIMADEPTASLDPDHRQQIGDLLLSLARAQGSTLIVISHETELLARLDRRLCLAHGELHEQFHEHSNHDTLQPLADRQSRSFA